MSLFIIYACKINPYKISKKLKKYLMPSNGLAFYIFTINFLTVIKFKKSCALKIILT